MYYIRAQKFCKQQFKKVRRFGELTEVCKLMG